LLWRA